MRNLLTVDKENFIQDMRIRVLVEAINATMNSTELTALNKLNAIKLSAAQTYNTDMELPLIGWNLEIRKFSKNDEGCYQCQLNSINKNDIHYCLKLESKCSIKSIVC